MFGAYGAYAAEVDVPYVATSGKTGTAHLTVGLNCNDPWGLQQALKDLGYPVTVTGQFDSATFKALRMFAEANGVAYTPSTFPKGDICQAIIGAWQAKQAPAAPAPVAAQAPTKSGINWQVLQAAQKSGLVSKIAATMPRASQEAGAGGAKEWWDSQSDGAKIAIGVGALALVGGLAWFLLGGKGEPAKAKANRRRRARRNGAKRLPAGYRMKTALAPGWVVAQDRQGMYVVLSHNAHTKHWDELEWADTFSKARDLGLRRVQRAEGRGAAWGERGRMKPNYRRAGKKAGKRRSARAITSGLPRTCRTKRPKGYPKKRSKYALPECMMYPLRTRKEVRSAASRFGHWRFRYSPAVRAKIALRIDRAKKRLGVGEYRVVRRRRRAR